MKGYLVLENGEIFEGERFGSIKNTVCEVVFNTAMAGYIETFTDPSYAGQRNSYDISINWKLWSYSRR